jgi:hypothetical protein
MDPASLRRRKRLGVVPDKPRQAQRRLLVCLSDGKGSFEMLHEKVKNNAQAWQGKGILRIRMHEDASMLHPTHMTRVDRIPFPLGAG